MEEKDIKRDMPENINEAEKSKDLHESSPVSTPEVAGVPKKTQFQDLLPVLGKYKIEDIKGNEQAIGMIVQLLLDKTEEKVFCENKIEKLQEELRKKSDGYISEKTKLKERWKSQLELQVLSFISALALGFTFQYKYDEKQFWLLLIIGVITGIFSFIMPFIINQENTKD